MQLHPKLKPVLEHINFLSRYGALYERFSLTEGRFDTYSNDEVLKIFELLGYKFKYNKKENFFGLKEQIKDFEFQFNISCKYANVELIWGLTKNKERLTLGGPWGLIGDLLIGYNCNIKDPMFTSYDDLQAILKEALLIYEDFKKEVIQEIV